MFDVPTQIHVDLHTHQHTQICRNENTLSKELISRSCRSPVKSQSFLCQRCIVECTIEERNDRVFQNVVHPDEVFTSIPSFGNNMYNAPQIRHSDVLRQNLRDRARSHFAKCHVDKAINFAFSVNPFVTMLSLENGKRKFSTIRVNTSTFQRNEVCMKMS